MGHERIGFLPKSKQWNAIIQQLQNYDGEDSVVAQIAANTLDALRQSYNSISYDPSLIAAIRFLAVLCQASNSPSQPEELSSLGVIDGNKVTMYSLLRGADNYISADEQSLEISKADRVSGGAEAYTYLGTANYVKHEGEKPMNITWELDYPIPAKYLKKTNKLVAG